MLRAALLFLVIAGLPDPAPADECAALARPAQFDAPSAMRAVFCEYDTPHGGTLVPAKLTRGWQVQKASVLATPMLATTYVEGGVTKGVLVVSRQTLEDGEPSGSHGTGAGISIYVFRKRDGAFEFEKGKRDALQAGSWGNPPPVSLVRLGEDRYGLWLDGNFLGQGVLVESLTVVPLDGSTFREALSVQTSMDNAGECGAGGKSCWSWHAAIELVPVEGSPTDAIRLTYSGKELNDDGKIVPKSGAVCYVRRGDAYVAAGDPQCARRPARKKAEVFPGSKEKSSDGGR